MTSNVYNDLYTPPPIFRDGMYLSATQLNGLNDSMGYLQGWWYAPNRPGQTLYSRSSINHTQHYWWCRHKLRYLKFVYASSEDLDYVKVYVNDVLVKTFDPPANFGIVTVDLEDTTPANYHGLAYNQFYTVGVDIEPVETNANMWAYDVYEEEPMASAWVNPTLQTATDLIDASALNELSAASTWLHDGIAGCNPPFFALRSTSTMNTTGDNEASWYLVHKFRYLHYRIDIDQIESGDDGIGIYWDGTEIFRYDTHGGDTTLAGCIDLYSSPGGLTVPTVGTPYKVEVLSQLSGDQICHILNIFESPEGC